MKSERRPARTQRTLPNTRCSSKAMCSGGASPPPLLSYLDDICVRDWRISSNSVDWYGGTSINIKGYSQVIRISLGFIIIVLLNTKHCVLLALFSSHPINLVNTKKPSHQIFRHTHGVLNEVYLQNFLHRWAVSHETNLISLLNSWFATVMLL